MRDLETRRLGDLISLQRGISWEVSQERDQPGDGTWPVLGIPNVQERLVLDRLVHLRVAGGKPAAARLASLGTILMVGSNGNPARVGNAVYIDRDDGFLFASFLIGARSRDSAEADPKFLFHFIASPAVQDAMTRSVRGTTGLQNLSQRFVEELRVVALPLSEQRQVAAVLDTLDDAVRKSQQIIAKLTQLQQGLLHSLLTRGIDGNGKLRDPERHPAQFKESQLGAIPQAWSIAVLDDLLESSVDGPFGSNLKNEHYVSEPGVRLVRLQNIGQGRFIDREKHWISDGHARSLARHDVRPGDVLVASLGDPTHPFARSCLYPADQAPGIVKADCFRLRTGELLEAGFLVHVLNTPRWRRGLAGMVHRSGISRDRVNLGKVRRLIVPLPPREEQQEIVRRILAAQDRLAAEADATKKLRLLKAGLMDDLLTGRVRVTSLADRAT